jgi:hypothetical protein
LREKDGEEWQQERTERRQRLAQQGWEQVLFDAMDSAKDWEVVLA